MEYKKLTQIANKHTTDKGTEYYEAHGYTEVYGEYISDICEDCSLLEIGIWHGDSIRMWNEYNPNLNVSAIDNNDEVKQFLNGTENFNLFIGNQSDIDFLQHVMSNSKSFDFVIDDGSHNFHDIITSFSFIFPKLKSGSIYFIEDLHPAIANKDGVVAIVNAKLTELGLPLSNASLTCNGKLLIVRR